MFLNTYVIFKSKVCALFIMVFFTVCAFLMASEFMTLPTPACSCNASYKQYIHEQVHVSKIKKLLAVCYFGYRLVNTPLSWLKDIVTSSHVGLYPSFCLANIVGIPEPHLKVTPHIVFFHRVYVILHIWNIPSSTFRRCVLVVTTSLARKSILSLHAISSRFSREISTSKHFV